MLNSVERDELSSVTHTTEHKRLFSWADLCLAPHQREVLSVVCLIGSGERAFILSTSKLQRFVSDTIFRCLSEYDPIENTRPDWLITTEGERLELDFLIESISIAIEVQGAQHYVYTPFFHQDSNGFAARLRRDRFKRETCKKAGITLYEIANMEDADMCFALIHSNIPDGKIQRPRILREHIPESEFIFKVKSSYPQIGRCNIAELRFRRENWISELSNLEKRKNDIAQWNSATRDLCVAQLESLKKRIANKPRGSERGGIIGGFKRLSKKLRMLDDPEIRLELLADTEHEREKLLSYIELAENMILAKSCY